jgi:hypothetical protein
MNVTKPHKASNTRRFLHLAAIKPSRPIKPPSYMAILNDALKKPPPLRSADADSDDHGANAALDFLANFDRSVDL